MTFFQIEQQNKELKDLLKKALYNGLHEGTCPSVLNFSELQLEEDPPESCNCWYRKGFDIVNEPEITLIDSGVCKCKHESDMHSKLGDRICSAESCHCMKFSNT